MDTIDITITKNKLQILMLQARENIKEKATNNKVEALDTLTDAYSTIVYLQATLQRMKLYIVILYSMDLKYIYYIVFMVCIVSFFAGLLTHYLFNRD